MGGMSLPKSIAESFLVIYTNVISDFPPMHFETSPRARLEFTIYLLGSCNGTVSHLNSVPSDPSPPNESVPEIATIYGHGFTKFERKMKPFSTSC